jgi:putative DNA primase/helicase
MNDETNSVRDGNAEHTTQGDINLRGRTVPAPASAGQPPGVRQVRSETLGVEDVEPWPESVDGRVLLDELLGVLERFVVLPKWAAETLALWVVHTYAYHLRNVSTYLGIESPQKRCGKTTLLSVLSELVNRPVVAANISPPAFFRVIEETRPTLLIDEADTFLAGNDELRGILNAGYSRKTAYVVRVATKRFAKTPNTKHQTPEKLQGPNSKFKNSEGSRLARFSCWCPKVMAAIGRLPETLADRCIVICMQRKTAQEQCERLRNLKSEELQRKCARFAQDNQERIASAQPELPDSLNDRAADIWEPLLALADLAGGDWPQLARHAAAGLNAAAQESNPIASLLAELAIAFVEADSDQLFSRSLVAALNASPDRPWSELNKGKPVTELWLAQQLRPYGIRPRTRRIGEERAKGYAQEDFQETFRRYVPRSTARALIAGPAEEEPTAPIHIDPR